MNTVQRIAKNTGAKGKRRKGNGYKGGPKFKELRVWQKGNCSKSGGILSN